jgi:RIO kinase 1
MSHGTPHWLVDDPVDELHLGTLCSGKEAQIDLVERIGADGRTCLLAGKRYLPRTVTAKGQLEALGVQRSSAFRNDVEYREGRQFRKSRDRRAVEAMTTYGKRLLQDRWLSHEHDVLRELHAAGCRVPLPVSFADDVLLMQYVGERDGAAPQLAKARLDRPQLRQAWHQLVEGLRTITAAGWAHGDLSAYNLLWWEDELWFIDLPQAVDLAANPGGLDFLHRDVCNVAAWFARRGVEEDPEALFADLLTAAFGSPRDRRDV